MTTMNANAVVWFDLYVDDMDRAVAFYEQVLGQKLEPITDPTGETQMMAFPSEMAHYGAAGALVKMESMKPGPGGSQLYFGVDDCADKEALVTKAGGAVIRPKFSIGEFGFIMLAQDSEGNIVGFNSMK
ncbi:MAG: VOC family protein [Alphaproteobacteria bacterium]